jgi:putative flippase GtrA
VTNEDMRVTNENAAPGNTAEAEVEYSRQRETTAERLDRNYNELLQELRVAQAGVQILFAFLLTLAFSQRFLQTSSFQRGTYVVTLLFAAGAAALLISPVAFHRFVFRRRQKDDLVDESNRLALGGLAMLLVAMVGAVLLILDLVLGGVRAAVLTAVVAAWFIGFWVVLPLARRNPRAEQTSAEE